MTIMLDMLTRDVRLGVRFLSRNLMFTAAAVLILTLGISLSAVLFAIVRGTLIEPWPYRGYDRLVTVRGSYPTQGRTDFQLWSAPEIQDLRSETDVFEHVVAGNGGFANLTYGGRAERVSVAVITPNAFEMLGVPALFGRTLDDGDARPGAAPAVLLSHQFWTTRMGGDPTAIGRTLRIGETVYTIVGVMPKPFVFWDRELWMPLGLEASDNRRDARRDRRYYVQAQLQPGVTIESAEARLGVLTSRMFRDHPDVGEYAGFNVAVRSLVDMVLRDLRPTLYLLLAAVALVLVVAIANLANATLAKAIGRQGEQAIRRAIGGSTGQIVRQLLVESALIGAMGGLGGASAAAFLLPQILSLIPYGYVPAEARVELDGRIVALATAVALLCGVLIGLVPALRSASVDPALLLKEADTRTGSRRTHRWRDAFVVAQLTLAVVVLGVAAAAASGLRTAVRRDPGYFADDIWTARIALPQSGASSSGGWSTYESILAALDRAPAVNEAALASSFPVGDMPTTLVAPETESAATERSTIDVAPMSVSANFFHLLGIAMLEGRPFADTDTAAQPRVAILTRGLARRLWPDGAAVGRRLTIGGAGGPTATVVGIVADVTTNGAQARVQPAVFLHAAQEPPAAVTIGIKTNDLKHALSTIDGAVRAVNADIPVYSPEMLAQAQIRVLGPKLLAATLLGLFGVTVLLLSSVGVYAVVSQSVQERAKELQIRLTFGAHRGDLFRRELARSGKMIVVSAVAGTSVAARVLRVVGASFEGFGSLPAGPLAGAVGILVSLALIATAIPAWRAVRFDDRRVRL